MRYDANEYLYASARIRAMEAHLLGRQQLDRLLLTASTDEFFDVLLGKEPKTGEENSADRLEAHAQERLREAIDAVSKSVPDPTLIHFLQYPYDCHNLKVLEKCRCKGTDPTALLVDLGSIDIKTLLTVSEKELYALLPTHLSAAIDESRTAYAKNADPREIDFVLDRAAFADMAESAAPFSLAAEWVSAKADLSNLLLCLRLLRMQGGEMGYSVLKRAALPGGSLSLPFLTECYDGGEELFCAKAAHTPYEGVFIKDTPLFEAECAADNFLMTLIRKARLISFGAEIPVAYLLATEAENKNLRILLAGKQAGLDRETILRRMRACYV